MARIFLTGGTGFVGQHSIRELLKRGHQVTALQHNSQLPENLGKQCEVVKGSLDHLEKFKNTFVKDGVVVHIAAHIPKNLQDDSETEICSKRNAGSTLELASHAAHIGIERFIYCSTAHFYDQNFEPCTEDAPVLPERYAAAYGKSKLQAEKYLLDVCNDTAMRGVILRLGSVYGPGGEGVIPAFLNSVRGGDKLKVFGGGKMRSSFIWVEDVAKCIAAACEDDSSGIFNIGATETISIEQLAKLVCAQTGKTHDVIQMQPAPEKVFSGFAAVSIAKAKQTWGIEFTPLAEGLRLYDQALK